MQARSASARQLEERGEVADEAALLTSVAARDGVAFRVLVDRHAPQLHRIAWRITGDVHEAEDIAQEALLRMWDHAPRWRDGRTSLAAWLCRVVVNLSIDRHRRSRRISGGDEVPDRADEAPLADAAIEADQQAARARALIAALPDSQRAAIVLTYYEDLSNADAALALDMKLKAFESLLFRARAALRAGFARSGDE
jgi:RNA polymerase sigma factor (sigma-70 family)